MVKNWLIRTKNNHILGPVSKQKIRELISNGSIKGDDEICSGNGYWIYVREQDLVAKYVLNDEPQPFNPVQEAEPVKALSPDKKDLAYPEEGDQVPSESDLEYPDTGESQADITKVGLNLSELQEDLSSGEMDLGVEEEGKKKKPTIVKAKLTEEVPVPQLKNRVTEKTQKTKIRSNKILEGRNLILLLLLFLAIAIYLLANRTSFIKEVIERTSSFSIIESSYAQTATTNSKKKWILTDLNETKLFNLKVDRTPIGFIVSSNLLEDMECNNRLSEENLVYALFAPTEQFKQVLKCYNTQFNFYKKVINYKNTPIKTSKKYQIKKYNFSRERRFLKVFRSILDEKFELETFYEFHRELRQYDNILAELLDSFIFIKLSNMSKAKKILLEITKKEFHQHIFRSQNLRLKLETQIELFKEVIKEISLYFEGQAEFRNMLYYLAFHTSGAFQEMLLDEFDVDLDINKIRNYYQSYSFGYPYPMVWGPIVYEMSSQVEYLKATELSKKSTLPKTTSDLLFYRGIDAVPRHAKEKVIELFKKLQESKDIYARFIKIKLLEDESFYSFLTANGIELKKILAAQKREFFQDLLAKEKFVSYAVIHLMSIGVWDRDFLFRVVENENNRI